MGKNAAQVLFPKVRLQVLRAMLLGPRKEWYLSQLARHTGAAPSHLHRELTALTEAGILARRVEGRQTYYASNPQSPLNPELTGVVRKLAGAAAVLRAVLEPFRSKIRCAFIFGSMARAEERAESDIDLFVVGKLSLQDLLPALRRAEHALRRPVNPTIYPPHEVAKKYRSGHHFIRSVLQDPAKEFLIGSMHELEAIAGGKTNQDTSHEPGRTGRAARGGRREAK
jgi:predicted nucleotidyltransferase